MQTDVAQPAIGAACVGMLRLLRSLGLEPDMVAGHSYGELVALHAAGVLDAEALAELSEARGRLMQEAGRGAGAMAALLAGPDGHRGTDPRHAQRSRPPTGTGPGRRSSPGRARPSIAAVELASARGMTGAGPAGLIAPSTPGWSPGSREPLVAIRSSIACGTRRTGRSTRTWTPRPIRPTRRPSRPAGRPPGQPRPVRRDDRRDVPRRSARVRRGRTGVDPQPDGRARSCTTDPIWRSPATRRRRRGLSDLLLRLARLFVAGLPLRFERLTAGGRNAGSTSMTCRPTGWPCRPRPRPGSSTAAVPGPSPSRAASARHRAGFAPVRSRRNPSREPSRPRHADSASTRFHHAHDGRQRHAGSTRCRLRGTFATSREGQRARTCPCHVPAKR